MLSHTVRLVEKGCIRQEIIKLVPLPSAYCILEKEQTSMESMIQIQDEILEANCT